MTIRAILADDHVVVRDGLKLILRAKGVRVLGEASDGQEALNLVRDHSPDVVIMDISMPVLDGIKATKLIREEFPASEVIILSMHGNAEHVRRALKAGARAYLLKESAGREVVQAVKAVVSGNRYLSRQVSDTLTDDYISGATCGEAGGLAALTAREREIMDLIIADNSSAAIAQRLGLATKTVETYRGRMMSKLGVRSIAGLMRFAAAEGLI